MATYFTITAWRDFAVASDKKLDAVMKAADALVEAIRIDGAHAEGDHEARCRICRLIAAYKDTKDIRTGMEEL